MKPACASPSAAAPKLELSGVVKRLGAQVALGPIDLKVMAGESLAVVGPSGAGKTTLLRLLLGLERPDAGAVRLSGGPLSDGDLLAARRRIGYVVQGGGLFPHLTAAGNAGLVARFLGWSGPRIEARVRELAAMARLPFDLFARYPAQLSGGQAQRVALVRALMLDPVTRAELQEDLARAFSQLGKTVVLVTHDLAEAAILCGRIALLKEGRLLQEGSLEDLVRRPVDAFVGRFVRAQRSPQDLLREAP